MNEVEYRFAAFEIREATDGSPGILAGIAMPYGTIADLGGGLRERFEPGAFGDVAGLDVLANWQHARESPLGRTGGGGLVLSDGQDALRATLTLPNTMAGRDVATLALRGVLRGWSVEFRALSDSFREGIRIVTGARLTGLAIVDKPAYGDALASLRARAIDASLARRRFWL